MAATGWREAGLLSLSTADHSRLPELLGHIATLKEASHVKVSLPSTRIDALSPEQFALLKDVSPVSSVTIAPEAGSQRLRNVINKDFSEQTITDTVGALLDNNVQTIKLYFMIGLPTENEADIDEMIRLIRDISVMARARGRRRQVNVAISPFSPKPSTPFQWEAMTGVDVLLHRSRRIKQELSEMRNVKVSYRDPDITLLETVMARGDRRVGALVMQAWKLGARFDGWDEHFDIDRWNRAARETGLSLQPFLQEIPEDVAMPWDVVCAGITRDFLLRERIRAYAEAITPDCRTGSCGACGLRRLCRLQPRNRDVATSQAAEPPPRPRAKSSAPKQPDQFWFRGVFSKMEGARFLSHRDTMELFHRAFLAAGVPLAFSQGFNPHPRMSFGPPLMLGAQGSCELFDFALLSRTAPELASLNRLLPSGLDITEAAALPGKPKSLMSVTIAGVYRIVPLVAVSLGEAGAAVESFMSKESVEVMPQREGKPAKDIRPLVEHVRVIAGSDGPAMEAILSLRGGATCRPEELIRALFPGRHWGEFLVTRTQLLQDPIPTS
jgi:radical SAM-linked protein